MPKKGKGKKQPSNAKAGGAGKKQKTSASVQAESVGDGAIVVAAAAMGAMEFHKGITKMRNLFKYRASERCTKAYLYIYIFCF